MSKREAVLHCLRREWPDCDTEGCGFPCVATSLAEMEARLAVLTEAAQDLDDCANHYEWHGYCSRCDKLWPCPTSRLRAVLAGGNDR